MCRQSNHPVLTQAAGELGDAIDALETATDWLLDRSKSNPMDTLAGATPYLRLFGLAAGGHYLAKGALAATQEEALDPACQSQAFVDTLLWCEYADNLWRSCSLGDGRMMLSMILV